MSQTPRQGRRQLFAAPNPVVRLVVRGGPNSLRPEIVRRQALMALEVIGWLGISTVAVWSGENLQTAWTISERLATRKVVWIADPAALATCGFEIKQTGVIVDTTQWSCLDLTTPPWSCLGAS